MATTTFDTLRELTFARMAARESFHDTVAAVLPEVYKGLPRGASVAEIDAAVDAHPRVQAAREVSRQAQAKLDEALTARAAEDRLADADYLARTTARAIRPAYDPGNPPVQDPADED